MDCARTKRTEQSNKETFHSEIFPIHRVPVANIKIHGIAVFIVNEKILEIILDAHSP